MPNNEAGFWTDAQQADERLSGTFVLRDNKVVYIRMIDGLNALFTDPVGRAPLQAEPLNSPLWHNFRKLPPLGWRNVAVKNVARKPIVGAIYLRRRAIRGRSHGYNANNVNLYSFFEEPGRVTAERNLALGHVYGDELNDDPNHYPRFEEAYDLLRAGTSAALSNKFALNKDSDNLTWLFRKRERVGLVTDANSILVLRSMKYYADDIRANRDILPADIKEL
jgi:hypothetical protein